MDNESTVQDVRDASPAARAQASEPTAASARRLIFPFVFDYTLYGSAMGLISMTTLLPMFLRSLTSSNVVIGLIPALQLLGASLPAILISQALERQQRLKKWLVITAIAERIPLIILGLWILSFSASAPRLALWGVLALWALYSLGNGVSSTVWINLIARIVPVQLRGRINGWGGAGAALTALVGAALARHLLATQGLARGYALCFVLGGGILAASAMVFSTIREGVTTQPARTMRLVTYLTGMGRLLRRDDTFRRFMAARVLWTIAASAAAFYTVSAMSRYDAGPTHIVSFTIAANVGAIVGSSLGGLLADHFGNRLALLTSTVVLAAAALLAAGPAGGAARGVLVMLVVFVLDGIGQYTGIIGGQNMPIELAPHGEVARYLAVATSLLAPVRALAPVAAGGLAEGVGYAPLFIVCALAALAAGAVFWGMPEPRRKPSN